jgi:hypothetical protein
MIEVRISALTTARNDYIICRPFEGVNMAADELVECPVCDRPIEPDATSCPGCGTVFRMYGIDELEKVAEGLDEPELRSDALEAAVMPERYEGLAPEIAPVPPPATVKADVIAAPKGKKGILSKLFGRGER